MRDSLQDKYTDTRSYLAALNRRIREELVPVSGTFELTRRCNLRCVHCYTGPVAAHASSRAELGTSRTCSIIDQMAGAGCLFLVLTGGEPLLRRDFAEIYRHAKEKGIIVTVFTNGTLVDGDTAALFKDLPPRHVEISIYGSTAETYERVTGITDSFEKCLKGIELLLEHGVPVKLKTVLMTLNRHEYSDMEKMARAYGVKFRMDAAIFPRENGDRTPLDLRVSPEEAVEKELANEDRVCKWKKYLERNKPRTVPGRLYNCGAGTTNFHVDAHGVLHPCLMTTDIRCDLSTRNFSEGWWDIVRRVSEEKVSLDFACNHCDKRRLCGFCPSFFKRETGRGGAKSDYLCAVGNCRQARIDGAATVTG